MKTGGLLFACGTAFYALVTVVYWFMSREPIGTTALALTGGLAFLIGFYALFTARRVGALPEDNEFAEITDADTNYGFFSPHSWTPFAIGLSTFVFVLGFVFASWLAVLGVMAILASVFGLLFEYSRGNFAE
jgi:hypothetical protein